MERADLTKREGGGCLKLGGSGGSSREAVRGARRVVFGAVRGASRAAGPAARPALRVHGHVQSLAWLAQSAWPACPVAVTQAFHLQDGADGSHRLLTPPWGHRPPVAATPKLIQVQT